MAGLDDEALGAGVLHHVAPRVVGAVVGAADRAVHVPRAAAQRAGHAARAVAAGRVAQARLPVLAAHLHATGGTYRVTDRIRGSINARIVDGVVLQTYTRSHGES